MWPPTRRHAVRAAAVCALSALVVAVVYHVLALRTSNSTAHLRPSAAGRLGNQVIRNVACSLFAKKHGLRFTYSSMSDMQALGIDLYLNGTRSHNFAPVIELNERNYLERLNAPILRHNVHPTGFFQTPELARYLRRHFQQPEVRARIVQANARYRHRYRNNSDVFVHVRLGDAADTAPSVAYYEKALLAVGKYAAGFISSDDLGHPTCRHLIEKYRLRPVTDTEPVETLLLASTCRALVLSTGTFSWLMGVLAFYSHALYHPNPRQRPAWHGDIFVFSDWALIDY